MKGSYVIYVPGLGDHHSRLQQLAISTWRVFGLKPLAFPLGWADGEAFQPKLERLVNKIDELSKDGDVSMVGTSAGASAVLNAFAQRKDNVRKVITICGKIQHPETIHEWRFKKNPAFRGSIELLPSSLNALSSKDRQRILNLYPLHDGIVPASDALLEGAHKKLIPTIGHAFSIGITTLLGGYTIAKFIKRD